MRMKRFLSFMLAAVMLASMAISASAATTLYYAQDFSSYTTIDGLLADTANWKGGSDPSSSAYNAITESASTGKNMLSRSSGIAGLSDSGPELVTANGVNWLSLHNAASVKTVDAWFVVVPDNTWDYAAESAKNETYIVSYDLKVNSRDVRQKTDMHQQTLWTDGTSANNQFDYIFNLRKDDAESEAAPIIMHAQKTQYNGEGKDYTLTNDTAYKLAASYTAKYNASGVVQNAPAKATYVNGATETSGGNAGYVKTTVSKLGALAIRYAYDYTMQISNIKMYTISNAANAFNVSRVGTGTIPTTGATVTVKISQPVYAPSFDPDAVTIEGLVNGEDFLVSDVTEVVGNVGSEIYSTATVSFLTNLEDASDYTITFPATIKNEIGTELGTNNKVTVTTPTPDVFVSNQVITKAWGTAAATTVSSFAADGVYGVSQDIKNNTLAAKDFSIIYAVYAGGKLADVVYANENIAGGATSTIGAGVNLPAATAGGQVKAFIWDGLTSIKPHTEAAVWNIAE